MTAQHKIAAEPDTPEPGQVSQIYAILQIIEQMARPGSDVTPIADETAHNAAYARASGVARRCFDAVAADAALAASAGAQVLLGKGEAASVAADQLARHLRERLALLGDILGA